MNVKPMDCCQEMQGLFRKNISGSTFNVCDFEDPKEIVKEVKSSEPEFNKTYKRVEELELSVRSMNCLKNDNIIYIGDLFKRLSLKC